MSTAEQWQALVPTDPLMALAWRDAVLWAIADKEMRQRFRYSRGYNAMRLEAKGGEPFFLAFVRWFNDNVWGDLNLKAGTQ